MEKRFCGIDLTAVAGRISGRKPEQLVAKAVLAEILAGDVPFHALHDDFTPVTHYCLLLLGRHGQGFYFVKLEGPHAPGAEREMEIPLIRHAIGALPSGGTVDAEATARTLLDSPYCSAVALLIGETRTAGINYGYSHNPAIDEGIAGRFLRNYLKKYLDERVVQN
jgi:hypothetical protein